MSKVTIELSEYNDLRDRFKTKCHEVKELESKLSNLEQVQAQQIEDLQKKGKVAVMVRVENPFLLCNKPKLESVANLDDVREEVKEYFLNNEKTHLMKQEFDKFRETITKPLEELENENAKLKATLDEIKALPWWKRLFNKF